MGDESSGAKSAIDEVLPQLASKETSRHWHCPPQTEAAIICNIKRNIPTDPKEKEIQPRHLVRFLTVGPPPCRVISSRHQVVSAPLKHFTYDYTEKAFTNSKGYTWTPMYLHYCKPLITEQFCNSGQNLTDGDDSNRHCANYIASKDAKGKDANRTQKIQVFPLLASNTSATAPFWTQGKSGYRAASSKPVSYSRFMESPYMRKRKSWVHSSVLLVNPPKIS